MIKIVDSKGETKFVVEDDDTKPRKVEKIEDKEEKEEEVEDEQE